MERKSILNDRIQEIILKKDLTPSYFADEIGVQRSSISHILANRNKPSLEIIHKILRRYPDISFTWLMEGVDEEYDKDMVSTHGTQETNPRGQREGNHFDYKKRATSSPQQTAYGSPKSSRETIGSPQSFQPTNSNPASNPLFGGMPASGFATMGKPGKEVVRVIMVYSDDTFDTLNLNKNL